MYNPPMTHPKTALITGVTGQDGSYLAELLILLGYQVHGIVRRSSSFNTARLKNLRRKGDREEVYLPNFFLHYGDITDSLSISNLIQSIKPDEVYNLAAQSHVRVSFEVPSYTGEATGLSSTAILEAIKQHSPDSRYYQASSSEMFGGTPPPQRESTPFYPRSPYGAAKLYAHWMTVNYREAHGLFACSGILFNHESPRRGENFVTKKIAKAAVEIYKGSREHLPLGNLLAERDWGYAPEYVGGIWAMLNSDLPRDLVLATGQVSSVMDFADYCFEFLSLKSDDYIIFDEKQIRPTEVDSLIGDAGKAQTLLDWRPTIFAKRLAAIMVEEELRKIESTSSTIDTPLAWGVEALNDRLIG